MDNWPPAQREHNYHPVIPNYSRSTCNYQDYHHTDTTLQAAQTSHNQHPVIPSQYCHYHSIHTYLATYLDHHIDTKALQAAENWG